MYTLIATAKLNDINPQAWLADVLARIADHPASRLHELLPWHWKTLTTIRPLPPDVQTAAVLGGCLLSCRDFNWLREPASILAGRGSLYDSGAMP